MKKGFISYLLLYVSLVVSAQQTIEVVNMSDVATNLGITSDWTTVQYGTMLYSGTNFNVVYHANDYLKSSSLTNNSAIKIVAIDTTIMNVEYGLAGQNNPKDWDGGNPANTLIKPSSGSVSSIQATHDGIIYLFHLGASNKQYFVFEDSQPLGYTYAMQTNDQTIGSNGLLTYTLSGDSQNNYLTANNLQSSTGYNRIVSVAEYTNATQAGTLKGISVIAFDVKAGKEYTIGGGGTKINVAAIAYTNNSIRYPISAYSDDSPSVKYKLIPAKTYVDIQIGTEIPEKGEVRFNEGVTGAYGDTITIEAIPFDGYQFNGWSDGVTDNPRTIILRNNVYLDALFGIKQYTLLLNVNNILMGSVIGGGSYNMNSQVLLQAIPNSRNRFLMWNDGQKYNPYRLTLDQDTCFTAIFMSEDGSSELPTDILVIPSTTDAQFIWPAINDGSYYTFVLWADSTEKESLYIHKDTILTDSLHLIVNGLDKGTQYGYAIVTENISKEIIDIRVGSLTTQLDSTIQSLPLERGDCIYLLNNPETQIYNLQGNDVNSARNNLPAGIYILRLGNKVGKMIIK